MSSPRSASSMSIDETEPIWRFQMIHGRTFNTNTRDETYILPVDEEEYDRQDTQHVMLKQAIGHNYGPPDLVQGLLSQRDGPAPGVLDLGCGTGTWAIEMAEEFPHAEVLGIDLVQPIASGPVPVNCSFEVDDVNLSLDHHAGRFDVVHGRIIDPGIRDYPQFLYSVARMLRPRGVLLLVKPELRLYNEKRQPMIVTNEGQPGFSAFQRVADAAHAAVVAQGDINEEAVWSYRQMLLANPNFIPESIVVRTLHIPVCPWPSGMNNQDFRICDMMRRNLIMAMSSWTPMLRNAGHPLAQIDTWIRRAEAELNNSGVRGFTRYTYCWAVRKPAPFIEPPLSGGDDDSDPN